MNPKINCIVKRIKRNRVLVIGDVMLDCSVYGEVSGVSAEAPIMTFREQHVSYDLGGAANVALNLLGANQDVIMVSVVGDDDNGTNLKSLLTQKGILSDGIIIDSSRKTTIKKRYFSPQHQQLFRADSEDTFEICHKIETDIFERVLQIIASVDVIVLSDYLKGCLTRSLIQQVVQLAHSNGIKVVVDPKDIDYTKYRNCDIIKPNKKELSLMTNKSLLNDNDILDSCRFLCHKNEHEAVVVTLGGDGMIAYNSKDEEFHLGALMVDVADVVGAGDTAIAYLSVGVVSGMELFDSVALAVVAAGKKVAQYGTVPINYWQLYDFPKIVGKEQIDLLKEYLSGKKIVFTNGCFDLLHAGHICSLQQAKSFGDVLVVGINTDSSVKRMKGKNRPIIKLDERIKTLEALACVDYIIPFDDDTPLSIISKLLPQVLVKGAEYKNKKVVGADVVLNNGGAVCFVEMYGDYSTSKIVKLIKEQNE